MVKKFLLALVVVIGLNVSAVHAANDVIANEEFKDWTYVCGRQDIAQGQCAMTQSFEDPETGHNIFTIVIEKPGYNETPQASLRTPLSVSLPEGVSFKIDDGEEEFQLAYRYCQLSGCRALIDLGDVLLPAMIKGHNLKLGYVQAYTQKRIAIKISLKGFTKAFQHLIK